MCLHTNDNRGDVSSNNINYTYKKLNRQIDSIVNPVNMSSTITPELHNDNNADVAVDIVDSNNDRPYICRHIQLTLILIYTLILLIIFITLMALYGHV